MKRALIEYKEQLFTFEESLLLAEALRRSDFARFHEIVFAAAIRRLNIPSRMLHGDTNYSSSRLERCF
jgi:hypothetical protein